MDEKRTSSAVLERITKFFIVVMIKEKTPPTSIK